MPKKPKPTISLADMPYTIFFVTLIVCMGAVFGLITYEIMKLDKDRALTDGDYEVVRKIDYFGNDFIQIKSPQKNAAIKNPVLISGKSVVFEASMRIRIKDNEQNILADTFIAGNGWMDKLYPFEKEIEFKQPQSKSGVIEIFEINAKDGSESNKVVIPVDFVE